MTIDEMIRAIPLFALVGAGLGGLWKLIQWAFRQYRHGRTDAEKAQIEVEKGRTEVSLLPLPAYQDLATRLEARVIKLENDRDELEARIDRIEGERDALRSENAALKLENAELRNTQQKLETRVAHLEAELALTKGK